MLVSMRLLSKFTKDFEKISLKKIADNISNKVWMEYDERVDEVVHDVCVPEHYPTYEVTKPKRTPKHLVIYRDEYLTILLHLFESYVEVYRTHDVLELFLSDDGTLNKSNNESYKQAKKRRTEEKNHSCDYEKIEKDWKQLNVAANEFATNDMIFIPKLVECQNVYVDPSVCVKYEEDLESIIQLKNIVDTDFELGDTFKKWHTSVSNYLSSCNLRQS